MPMATREAQRAYQREWYARRRAEWFADKVCVKCGATEDLQIDHRDPAEKITNSIWSWRLERREAELAKCDVRCADCHRARHASPHGSYKRYQRYRCRCAACRAANAQRQRAYKARKRKRKVDSAT